MPRIKYVGLKEDGETAFASECGIERFMPGTHQVVDDTLAAKMLKHPDVFALADAKEHATLAATQAPAAPVPTGTLAPGAKVGDAPVDPLDGLDDKGIKAWVKAQGLVVPGINPLKGEKLLAKVRAAIAQKQ